MKNKIIALISALAASSLSAQSFVAGWDFDGVAADATSAVANWGEQSGVATASWTNAPLDPPNSFVAEYGVSTAFNDDSINDAFGFVDSATGFTAFSQNFNNSGEFGFQSLTSDDTFSLSFDGSNFSSLELTFAFATDEGESFSVQTVDLSSFDGNASAVYNFAPAENGVYDNFIVTGTVVPEPSSFAAIAGALALGFVALRRRRS